MNISIIGAGGIGGALAKRFAAAGIGFAIANRGGPASLTGTIAALTPHARAVTVREAAAADIVFVAVPWTGLPTALGGLPDWGGRIVVDANNPILQPGFRIAELGGRTSSEAVAELVPGARLVKAFNTLPVALLAADPQVAGGRRVVFYSGDDAGAKQAVAGLIERLGFAGIDLGRLAEGGKLQQFPGGPLPALDLVKRGA